MLLKTNLYVIRKGHSDKITDISGVNIIRKSDEKVDMFIKNKNYNTGWILFHCEGKVRDEITKVIGDCNIIRFHEKEIKQIEIKNTELYSMFIKSGYFTIKEIENIVIGYIDYKRKISDELIYSNQDKIGVFKAACSISSEFNRTTVNQTTEESTHSDIIQERNITFKCNALYNNIHYLASQLKNDIGKHNVNNNVAFDNYIKKIDDEFEEILRDLNNANT